MLNNDYRLQKSSGVYGNAAIKDKLKYYRENGYPQSILLTGPSGCGKTSLAHLIARDLGKNIKEINASADTGKEAMERCVDSMKYKSLDRGNKIYFLDECHKISKAAQNSLLKVIEEPNDGVYIILATTDPQNLLKTFHRRCATLAMEPLSTKEATKFIDAIAERENIQTNTEVINAILDKAEGSPGFMLKYLEGIRGVELKDRLRIINNTGSTEDYSKQFKGLMKSLLNGDRKRALNALKTIKKSGEFTSSESLRYAVLGYADAVALNGNPVAADIIDNFTENTYNNKWAGITLAIYLTTEK